MSKVNLTAKFVQAAKPANGKRAQYIDDGLALRVSPSGHKSWAVISRFEGKFIRLTIGTYPSLSLKEARAKADEALQKIAKGTNPAFEKKFKREAGTFGMLMDRFLESRKDEKSHKEYKRILEKYFKEWHGTKAHAITPAHIIEKMEREEKRGPAHARKAFAVLHAMFNFGLGKLIVETNPCHGLPRPGKANERDRVLSAEEIRKVWGSIEKERDLLKAQFKLRFYTAQRGGEVLTIEWSEIDFEGAFWNIPAVKSKNGHAHRVPLCTQALEILKELKQESGELKELEQESEGSKWVFPSRFGADKSLTHVQKAIQRVRSRKGCEISFTGHDIRRTAASHMAGIGVPRFTIRKLLNHKDQEITAIYDRYSYDKEKREALQLWANYLDEIVSKPDTKHVIPLVRSAQVTTRGRISRNA